MEQALARAKESVALFRSGQADGSLAEVLITLGQIMRAQGDATAALGAMTEALRFTWAVGPRVMLAVALEGLADLGATPAQAEPSVRLLAGAAALREQMGTPVRPADRPAVEHSLAIARSALGADAFAVVWAEAQALPLEQLLSTIPIAAPLDALRDRVGR